MKKWSEMSIEEKLDFILEWMNKTHEKVDELVYTVNEIIDSLENGIDWLEHPQKVEPPEKLPN